MKEEILEVKSSDKINNKVNKKSIIKKIILCILFIIYVIVIGHIEFQNDTFFDIKLGEKYLNDGFYFEDDFSIHKGLKSVSHHSAVALITYCIYSVFSFKGLYILQILLATLMGYLFYKINNLVVNKKIAYAATYLEMFMMTGFISVRAQMYSYIFFLLEILFIEKYIKTYNKKYLIFLSILPILIVNFHSGVIFFYYIIMGVYLLRSFKNKNIRYLLIPCLIGIFTMFINPYGIEGVTYALKTLGNDFINNNIAEFQKPILNNLLEFYLYIGFIIITLIISKKNITMEQGLFLLGTTFMTLLGVRHFSLMVICTATLFAQIVEYVYRKMYDYFTVGVPETNRNKIKITFVIMFVFIISIFCFGLLASRKFEFVPNSSYPIEATKYIKENIGNDKKIFNMYNWGSYLMLNDVKVFIDSRADLYTKEYNNVDVADDYAKITKCLDDYDPILEKYDIEYLLLDKECSVTKFLKNDKAYDIIYEDDICYIFKRNM